MQNDCFPDSNRWPKESIAVLARINPRYPVRNGTDYPFVPMAGIGENFRGIQSFETRPAGASGLSRFAQSDTVFAKITPCPENGKVAFVDELPGPVGLGSTEFIVLSPRAETDPRFLYHLLCSHEVRGHAVARMEGSTGRQRVPEDVFTKRLLVPIPSPIEQRSIARILDAVDEAIEAADMVVELARRLRTGLLADLLAYGIGDDGRLRSREREHEFAESRVGILPKSWELSSVGEEFALQTGITLNEARRDNYSKHPYLRVANVRREDVDLSDVQTVGATEAELGPRRLQTHDLLVVEGHANSREIGRCALTPPTAAGMTFQNHLFRLRSRGRVIPEFACLWLNSQYARRYWDARCGTSSGLNTINQRVLRRLVIPIPSRLEQAAIVDLARAHRTDLDGSLARAVAVRQLKNSLAHDLLSGRVPATYGLLREGVPA
jgi:type I restriction enzyme, S subunit